MTPGESHAYKARIRLGPENTATGEPVEWHDVQATDACSAAELIVARLVFDGPMIYAGGRLPVEVRRDDGTVKVRRFQVTYQHQIAAEEEADHG